MRTAISLHGLLISLFCAGVASAQPAPLPPPASPPLVRVIELRFPAQGNQSVIDSQTYLYYIHTQPSRPSQGIWVPYDERTLREDFKRLWATNFLDDLRIELQDVPYDNGVVGKHVVFVLEERQRVKVVEYRGSKKLDRAKIDEQLRARGIELRLDSFLDSGVLRRIEGVLREMMAEKGYAGAEVAHTTTAVAGGPKLVNVAFTITEGPKLEIRAIEFTGNTAKSDGTLRRQMKDNKKPGFLGWITGGGTYKADKFETDADRIQGYYRNEGYVRAQIGQPEIRTLQDSRDGKTRWIQLRIPVTEGLRYRVGELALAGNTVVTSDALMALFKAQKGDWYSEKRLRDGLIKAREIYGAGGYMEFTGFPDLKTSDAPGDNVPAALAAPPAGPPTVDVTMRLQEGQQYFVNRITFVGNATTRDKVVRREMRLAEGAVFNTEALKFSIRRINQLGYFKPVDDGAAQVQKTTGRDNHVDVTLKVEEQNRNQITFGAGASQFEGFFGQVGFQTANFLGRGETLNVSMQAGSRTQNYQLAFTEPYVFDRPLTAGFDVFKREVRFISQFTQKSSGGTLTAGFPVADFTRMFVNYGYERVTVSEINELFFDPLVLARNPFLRDSLLLAGGVGGADKRARTISKIGASLVHNTVDQPIFPTRGRRYTAAIELAGPGGNTRFFKPRAEGLWIFPHTSRTSLALRGDLQYITPLGRTKELPIFENLFQGGEFSIRGFDIRTIGPRDPATGLVLGGNKSLLFNAEYLVTIAGPVRLVLFYDAGQVQGRGEQFRPKDFRTSTGAELRFFMPVLNVPFRLIFAANPQRAGVLDDTFRPAKAFSFKFAVGSTF